MTATSATHQREESMAAPAHAVLPHHRLDDISFGKIVQVRETLLRAQAQGTKVYRLESGDPSFSVAPHILVD